MRLSIDAFKVAAWMLLRDLMAARGLTEEWLREQLGDERATFISWLRSHERHRVEEYCELILQAEKMAPRRRTEPFDAGYEGIFREKEYGERHSSGAVGEVDESAKPPHASLMLLDLAVDGLIEDVEAERLTAKEAHAAAWTYFQRLPGHSPDRSSES